MIVREDPARTSEVAARVGKSTPGAVSVTVTRAHDAHRQWARLDVAERCTRLLQAADACDAAVDEVALQVCRETGKPLGDCAGEARFALMWLRWVCAEAPAVLADGWTDDAQGQMLLQRKPFGVVAAITPWNAPLILTMLKVAPALAAGNAVVVKPSPLAPIGIARLLEVLCASLGLELALVVQGGAEVGDALVRHPLVRKVCFTGGEATGRIIAATAGEVLRPTVMELGGNDPVLLLDDADLSEAAVARLVGASFSTSGQVCMAAKRIYVPASRLDELVSTYETVAARELVTGDPLDPATTMGPVVSEASRARVRALVQGSGGEVRSLGPEPDAEVFARGWFERPTLVLGLDDAAPLVSEEQFGPSVPIVVVRDVEDAIARANAGELGLGASVWSQDTDRAFAVARRLEAGITFVNTHNRTGMALRAPFGGVKGSGWGREYGHEGMLGLTQTCVVNAPAAYAPGAAAPADARAYPGS